MRLLFLFLVFASSCCSAWAKILIYEYGSQGSGDNHGFFVTQIACRNLETECETFYSEDLSPEDLSQEDLLVVIERNLSFVDVVNVVNMSFTFQDPPKEISPGPYNRRVSHNSPNLDPQTVHEGYLKNFKERRNFFERMIAKNPRSLFVAAAGNGFSLGYKVKTPWGVPIDTYKVFPAFMDAHNLITVSSLDDTSVDVQKRTDYRLMKYANYSVKLVDLAAPVELTNDGKPLSGTSFAAPYVSRVSKQMIDRFGFEPVEVKSIFLRSAFIENLSRTIVLTREYNDNQRESVIHRIVTLREEQERDALREEIADVMLVKSGGALVLQVAFKCAENYAQAKGVMTISEACLMAHESELGADVERQTQLKEFWSLRNIL